MIFCAVFDIKTGKVTGISNNPDPNSAFVEISRELYSKFVNVEEDINNYIVINENKKYQIIKKGKEFVEEVANENVIPLKKFFKLPNPPEIASFPPLIPPLVNILATFNLVKGFKTKDASSKKFLFGIVIGVPSAL